MNAEEADSRPEQAGREAHCESEEPAVGGNRKKIAELNDAFRETFRGGEVLLTASVAALPSMVKAQALLQVSSFNSFTRDNDPHGEHDFGSFEQGGQKFFWKIDYYDQELQYGSPDPSKPELTTRALTIMFAHEY